MLAYTIELTPDDNDTLMVTCETLPEVVTFGDDADDAAYHAADAIFVALAGRIAHDMDIPIEAKRAKTGPHIRVVAVPALVSTKVMLYRACRAAGVTRAELARRLDWHREQVDRLFRLDHKSRLDQLEAAFAALGRRLEISDRAAA